MDKRKNQDWPAAIHTDPETGAAITRLTPADIRCAKPYFYQRCFTSDGNGLLVSVEAEGTSQLWMLDIARHSATQAASGGGISAMGAFLSPDDRSAYFIRDRREFNRVNMETGKEETVYRVSDGWQAYGTWSANSACTHAAALEILETDNRSESGSGWDRFHSLFHRSPRMRLLSIELATGKSRVLLDERRFLGHPMYRPHDDSRIGFCHEGPHDLVTDRLWIHEDGPGAEGSSIRPVYEQGEGEACMHEFWIPDGSRLAWVRYAKGEHMRSIMTALLEPGTGNFDCRRIMDIPPCAHLMSNHDGSLFVGDGAMQAGDLEDKGAYAFVPDPYIYLFNPGQNAIRKLCRHESSCAPFGGSTQINHPHPCFTPDGKSIVFVSDVGGMTGVYCTTIGEAEHRSRFQGRG